MSEELQLRPSFDIQWFDDITIIVEQVEEMSSFKFQRLKCHFPNVCYIITFALLTKIP